jgi:hypothetical protein
LRADVVDPMTVAESVGAVFAAACCSSTALMMVCPRPRRQPATSSALPVCSGHSALSSVAQDRIVLERYPITGTSQIHLDKIDCPSRSTVRLANSSPGNSTSSTDGALRCAGVEKR